MFVARARQTRGYLRVICAPGGGRYRALPMPPIPTPGRLHIRLQPTREEVFEPDYLPEAPLIRFEAYRTADRMFGWVRLQADRLTDLLNDHDELLLTDVKIESLVDGRTRFVDEILVQSSELIAVHASGPRGDESLRQVTVPHPVALRSGDYLIGGFLHVPPDSDPMASLDDRPMMLPLTDAWIEYRSGEEHTKQSSGTVIVNRAQVDWMRVVGAEDL